MHHEYVVSNTHQAQVANRSECPPSQATHLRCVRAHYVGVFPNLFPASVCCPSTVSEPRQSTLDWITLAVYLRQG
ncbi:hypothetical protein PHLCEN_2v11455 [Hermanssonia centrifuga]|uniref:Uncharacterized protein n=1 Tax=Hermanssonia centrifuga TaxID=98765 RepID=A0A2R6NK53_9APHY|nr:hypothetical protein PHLCEN_2v11455 [Hermanssonia centrifuga]